MEPNFDLLGLDVGENRTFPYKLLTSHGAGFGAVVVEPLECLNLLGRVPHILAVIQYLLITILARRTHTHHPRPLRFHQHLRRNKIKTQNYSEKKKKEKTVLQDSIAPIRIDLPTAFRLFAYENKRNRKGKKLRDLRFVEPWKLYMALKATDFAPVEQLFLLRKKIGVGIFEV